MNITAITSENICLLIHSLRKAVIYVEAVKNQPEVSMESKQSLFNPIENKVKWAIDSLGRRVGPESLHLYNKYVKQADSILLDNCQRMIAAMPPQQQEVVENIIQSIYKGEKIKLIQDVE